MASSNRDNKHYYQVWANESPLGFRLTDKKKRFNAWVHSLKNETVWKDTLELDSQLTNIDGEDMVGKEYKEIVQKIKKLKKFPVKFTFTRPANSPHIKEEVVSFERGDALTCIRQLKFYNTMVLENEEVNVKVVRTIVKVNIDHDDMGVKIFPGKSWVMDYFDEVKMNAKTNLKEEVEIKGEDLPIGTELTIVDIIKQYTFEIADGETLKIVDKELMKYTGYFVKHGKVDGYEKSVTPKRSESSSGSDSGSGSESKPEPAQKAPAEQIKKPESKPKESESGSGSSSESVQKEKPAQEEKPVQEEKPTQEPKTLSKPASSGSSSGSSSS